MFKKLMTSALLIGATIAGASTASAEATALTNLNNNYGVALTSCFVCHSSTPALNVFGADFKAEGGTKGASYIPNWTNLSALDSDGDGVANDAEFAAGTDPALAPGATGTTQETASVTGCMTGSFSAYGLMLLGLLISSAVFRRKKS